jgi:hypothetical protein
MAGQRKTSIAIDPAISMGFAPSGLFVKTPKLFVPNRTFGPVHHLICTNDAIIAPVQGTFEK